MQENIPGYSIGENLAEIFPNPVCNNATILYTVPETGPVEIIIYNLHRQEMTTLVNKIKPAGKYSVIWSRESGHAVSLPGGVYFCRLTASGKVQTAKIVIAGE